MLEKPAQDVEALGVGEDRACCFYTRGAVKGRGGRAVGDR